MMCLIPIFSPYIIIHFVFVDSFSVFNCIVQLPYQQNTCALTSVDMLNESIPLENFIQNIRYSRGTGLSTSSGKHLYI